MFTWWKKQSLSMKVLIGMISGIIVGMIWGPGAVQIKFIGDIFINLLKMSLIPNYFICNEFCNLQCKKP